MARRVWPGLLWLLAAAAVGSLLTLTLRRRPGPTVESVHPERATVEQTLVLRGRLQRASQIEVRPGLSGGVVGGPPSVGRHVEEGERLLALRAEPAFVGQVQEALANSRDARFAVRRLERVAVRSEVAGRLVRFDVAAGAHVAKGQTLATVDGAAGERAVEAPVAGQLLPFLASPGVRVAPDDDLPLVFVVPEETTREPEALEAAVEPRARERAAQAQLGRFAQAAGRSYPDDRLPVDRAFVTAPVAGEVTWVAAGLTEGTPVRPEQKVMVLASRERVVLAKVHEVDYPSLQPGQAVTITFDAFPERMFPARLASKGQTPVDTVFDQFSEYDAVFSLSVPPDLADGLSCNVVVTVGARPSALSLPISALVRSQGRTSVWVRRGEGWESVPLQTGLVGDLRAEVLGGVTPADEVAVKPEMVPKSARAAR